MKTESSLKRRVKAFHELLRRAHGVRSFTYVEGEDGYFDIVSDDQIDFGLISALIDEEDTEPPTLH